LPKSALLRAVYHILKSGGGKNTTSSAFAQYVDFFKKICFGG